MDCFDLGYGVLTNRINIIKTSDIININYNFIEHYPVKYRFIKNRLSDLIEILNQISHYHIDEGIIILYPKSLTLDKLKIHKIDTTYINLISVKVGLYQAISTNIDMFKFNINNKTYIKSDMVNEIKRISRLFKIKNVKSKSDNKIIIDYSIIINETITPFHLEIDEKLLGISWDDYKILSDTDKETLTKNLITSDFNDKLKFRINNIIENIT